MSPSGAPPSAGRAFDGGGGGGASASDAALADEPRHEEITPERFQADITEVKNIGSGSFGCAILVESQSTGERFVAKKISLEHLTDDERQKAQQEASLLRAFRHVNITEYLGSFIIGNTLHIIMEYCSGGTLQQAMARREAANESFDEEEVFDIQVTGTTFSLSKVDKDKKAAAGNAQAEGEEAEAGVSVDKLAGSVDASLFLDDDVDLPSDDDDDE